MMNAPRPELPENPDLSDVFRQYPAGVRELLRYHDILLRGDSPLAIGERELIAAFVSGLNACTFCLGAHTIIAETFGIDESTIAALVQDVDQAPIAASLKPLLKYVAKLTRVPASVTQHDRDAVYAAGWNERALYDAVATCALFNFMNRLVEGMGVTSSPAIRQAQRQRHAHGKNGDVDLNSYMNYGRRIGVIED